jgi:predicted O-methyltransferase YrrM
MEGRSKDWKLVYCKKKFVNWFQFKSYFKYLLTARHAKGYGIHSPFVFSLVRDLIYQSSSYPGRKKVQAYRRKLRHSRERVKVFDHGAGSKVMKTTERMVSDIYRWSSIRPKYGRLLSLLVQYFEPHTILELGTSLGVSTLHLALPYSAGQVTTIEGCPHTAAFTRFMLKELNVVNVEQVSGQFEDVLPDLLARLSALDFVFIDGNHQETATLSYFNLCLGHIHNDTILVFDDIHWSSGMEQAWQKIVNHPQVTVSVDLFQLGIIFFRKECQKQHFVVRY